MLTMSPFCSLRCDGRGLPKIIAGLAIGVVPMMRKSMSPPPSRMAAPAAARSSYSITPGFGARDHRLHGALAQHAGLAHGAQLLLAVHDHQLVHEALGEHELGIGQRFAQHVVLVDRQIVVVARVHLDEPDAAALELEFLEALDHDLGIFAAAAVAHVGERGAHSRRQASAWVPPIENTSVGSPSSGTTT